MANRTANTVQELAHQEAGLTKEEQLYLSSISIFYESYKKGEITQKEMTEIEEKIAKKTGINNLSVYRINDLIIPPYKSDYCVGRKGGNF